MSMKAGLQEVRNEIYPGVNICTSKICMFYKEMCHCNHMYMASEK